MIFQKNPLSDRPRIEACSRNSVFYSSPMYVTKRQANELTKDLIRSLTDNLKSASDFLLDVLKQDDWSFVIKAHALIESAVTEMLIARIGEPVLKPIVERLPLSDSQVGKMLLAKQLGLLSDGQRRFVRWFSELRNQLVHKVENVSFTFETHWVKLDSNQRKNWRESIIHYGDDDTTTKAWERMVESSTKTAIFMAVLMLMSECSIQQQQTLNLRKLEELSKVTMQELFAKAVPLEEPATSKKPRKKRT